MESRTNFKRTGVVTCKLMIIAKLDMDGTFRLQSRIAVLLHFLAAISKNRLLCKSWQLLATVKLTNYVIKWRGKMHFSKYTQFSFIFAVCPKINTILFFKKYIFFFFTGKKFWPKKSIPMTISPIFSWKSSWHVVNFY